MEHCYLDDTRGDEFSVAPRERAQVEAANWATRKAAKLQVDEPDSVGNADTPTEERREFALAKQVALARDGGLRGGCGQDAVHT
jgi:hypothetical protein